MPDLASPVTPPACFENPAHFFGVNQITFGPIRGLSRVSGNGRTRIIGCWGDRQNTADRLGPKSIAVFFSKSGHLRNGRSSSAWAKYALVHCPRTNGGKWPRPSSGFHWPCEAPYSLVPVPRADPCLRCSAQIAHRHRAQTVETRAAGYQASIPTWLQSP